MARVRLTTKALGRLLDELQRPVYLLDERRRVIYLNDACWTWLKVESTDLLGEVCSYQAGLEGSDVQRICGSMCPPLQTFRGAACRFRVRLPQTRSASEKNGGSSEVRSRDFEAIPINSADTDHVQVLAISLPTSTSETPDQPAEWSWLHQRLNEVRALLEPNHALLGLVGECPALLKARTQVEIAMSAAANVVLVGVAGSGREQIARAIHRGQSGNETGPLIPLACPLVDAEMLQTTILDLNRQSGQWQNDQPGTLLLLDIDQLSDEGQHELHGFLTLPNFTLNLLATSSQTLERLASQDRFLAPLASLLTTLEIRIPPLVERVEDIPIVSQWLLERQNAQGDRQLSGFTPDAMDILTHHAWDEDLEELDSVIRYAHQSAEDLLIDPGSLPPQLRWAVEMRGSESRLEVPANLDTILEDVEREMIERALVVSDGNRAKASRLLGISRPRFLRRLQILCPELAKTAPKKTTLADDTPVDEEAPTQWHTQPSVPLDEAEPDFEEDLEPDFELDDEPLNEFPLDEDDDY